MQERKQAGRRQREGQGIEAQYLGGTGNRSLGPGLPFLGPGLGPGSWRTCWWLRRRMDIRVSPKGGPPSPKLTEAAGKLLRNPFSRGSPALLFLLHIVCALSRFSHVRLCATLWTVTRQAENSVHGIFQARILE